MKDGTYEYDGYKIKITDDTVVSITESRPNLNIVIPNGVKYFGSTWKLEAASIKFPDTLERIDRCHLDKCNFLEELVIPNSVKCCELFLSRCTSLKRLVLGKQVSEIDLDINECLKLEKIIVNPENEYFTSMDGVLFSKDMKTLIQCPTGKRGTYKVPASVDCIDREAFGNTHLTEILLPDSVTFIGDQAFVTLFYELKKIDVYHPGKPYMPSVYDLTLPPHLKSIAFGCFRFTNELHSVFIPKAVTSIESCAFQQTSVQTVTFEEDSQLFDIGNCAFERSCIETFCFPSQLKYVYPSAFFSCKNLESLSVSPKNRTFSVKDGVVFKNCGKTLFRAPCSLSGSYTVPKGVTRIEGYAFQGCLINGINLPQGLRSIGELAFDDCTRLKEISLPETIRKVDNLAFGKRLEVKGPDSCTNKKFFEALSQLKKEHKKVNCTALSKYEKIKNLDRLIFTTLISQALDEKGFMYAIKTKKDSQQKPDYHGLKPFFIKCHYTSDNKAIQRLLDKVHNKGFARFIVLNVS